MTTWAQAVQAIANFYLNNVHTYLGTTSKPRRGRKAYSCSVLGHNVYDDCSGFTSACLLAFGAFSGSQVPTSGYFATTSGSTAAALRKAGFSPFAYNKNSLLPFDIIAMNGHVEIYAGNGRSYAWGNIHDTAKGGLPCYMAKDAYSIIWRNNGVSLDTTLNLGGNTLQELMNSEYGSGQTKNTFSFTSATYPTHDEYDMFSGTGGSIFMNSADNAISFAALITSDSSTEVYDNVHTRIYSTNDACIVLDELRLPMDSSDISYANLDVTEDDVKAYNERLKNQLNLNINNSSTGNTSIGLKSK